MFQVVTNWSNAVEQGQLAGASMTGQSIMYQGVMTSHSEKLFGIPVMMIGRLSPKGTKATHINWRELGRGGSIEKLFCKEKKLLVPSFLEM